MASCIILHLSIPSVLFLVCRPMFSEKNPDLFFSLMNTSSLLLVPGCYER